MIIIKITDKEPVEKALRKYKKKFERIGVVKELKARQTYEKKSVKRRQEVRRAQYRQEQNKKS